MKIYLASGNAHKVQEFQAIADASTAAGGVEVVFVSAKAAGGMPAVTEDTGTFVGNARKKAAALRAQLVTAYPENDDGLWVLADDSGICVDALGGRPGVESAYFAGPEGDSAANLRKLVAVMKGVAAEAELSPNIERPTGGIGREEDEGADAGSGKAQGSTFDAERLSAANRPLRARGYQGCDEPLAGRSRLPAVGRGAHFMCVLVLLGPEGVEKVFEGRCDGTLLVEPRGGAGFGYDPLFVPTGETKSLAELGEALKNRISHRARAARRLMEWLESGRATGTVDGRG